MIISDSHKFVYYDPPKTASAALDTFFTKNYGGGAQKPLNSGAVRTKHGRQIPDTAKDYFKVVSVRNPFERIISFYYFSTTAPHSRGILKYNTEAWQNIDTFIDFCVRNVKTDSYTADSHQYIYFPVWKFLEPMGYDAFVRKEHLSEDLAKLPFIKGTPSIPKTNTTKKYPTWEELETPERKEKIIAWAGKDFELFGYEQR